MSSLVLVMVVLKASLSLVNEPESLDPAGRGFNGPLKGLKLCSHLHQGMFKANMFK